jgi:hypothetical protein
MVRAVFCVDSHVLDPIPIISGPAAQESHPGPSMDLKVSQIYALCRVVEAGHSDVAAWSCDGLSFVIKSPRLASRLSGCPDHPASYISSLTVQILQSAVSRWCAREYCRGTCHETWCSALQQNG